MRAGEAAPVGREDGGEMFVRVELTASTLGCLMAAGHLCAADFRCLDCESKNCVWRMCLMNCIKQGKTRWENACPCGSCGQCDKGSGGAGPEASRTPRAAPITPVNDDKL